MRRRVWLWVLAVVATVTVLLGLSMTAIIFYGEHIRSLVLCTDTEVFTCSGHYVYGVPNEVWSVALTLFDVALLTVSIALQRRTPRAGTSVT